MASEALRFARTSPNAVVLTIWPSATGHAECGETVSRWLAELDVKIVHEETVSITSDRAALLMVMALYAGEEWLESNCWYNEQPLPSGPPEGPWAGAKWKRALCFRNCEGSLSPRIYVLDVGSARGNLWAEKYSVRSKLARASGNPGNSCIHLSDKQTPQVLAQRGRATTAGGMSCDESYAYACARCVLHPGSLAFLNSADAAAADLDSEHFRAAWARYTSWLGDFDFVDDGCEGGWRQAPRFA
eukprot:gnl/TRDRNA2_/TRDRNA2_56725_c0_seq1.p1 gnl/TRDRNA2_/TRDRNA2_56725_c0~~gnl/TRDRNA2_/TRDRNA2_56725_c0_seq1.p1  ORF type:complete len:244 (-),score=26.82 gnl/TRDRNA2_/TRDRNA2_56725_c0_seq1:7-738(-)